MDKVASVVFSVSSVAVMPFWILMVFAPRWRGTARVIESPGIVLGAIALYAGLVLPLFFALLPALARPELSVIAGFLGSQRGATIAWVHFLALDLFTGRWIFLDARHRGLSAWIVSPLLVLTLMFAPIGLGAYLVLVAVRARREKTRSLWKVAGEFAESVADGHRGLALLSLGALGLLAASLGLQIIDVRQVVGAPTWLKPAKFSASIAVTAPVLAWILGQMRNDRRWAWLRRAGTLIAVVAAFELLAITVQAARGVPSHFNHATRTDALVFSAMGAAIGLLWVAELFVTVRAFGFPFASPTRTWAIRLGLVGTLLGGAIGFVMPRPTASQIETLRAHRPTPRIGAHAVGVPDGGPGLPITRWSTEGGDLRAPHFFGLHALQGLPLVAAILERRRKGARQNRVARAEDPRLVIGFGVGWIGLTVVTFWQALRGQPLLAPDGITLAAIACVGLAAVVVALGDVPRLAFGRRGDASHRHSHS